jgi:hypothetical protein
MSQYISGLRLVAFEPPAPPQRGRLPRRRILMVAKPGIDGLLRTVLADG